MLRLLAILIATLVPVTGAAQLKQQIESSILASDLTPVELYRGATSANAFTAGSLATVGSQRDLVSSIASRLMSTSGTVSGLTSSPQTAGSFALGVKDRDPETIKVYGAKDGYIGVTSARAISAGGFSSLLDRFGGTTAGVRALQEVLGEQKIVVDATRLVQKLASKYPGILTAGFREMIDKALSREAEYLVFGKQPAFKRVVKVGKSDVIDTRGSVTGSCFNGQLSSLLAPRTKKPTSSTAPQVRKPVIKTTVLSSSATRARSSTRARPRRQSRLRRFFGRLFRGARR